jgi:hypothetical protein
MTATRQRGQALKHPVDSPPRLHRRQHRDSDGSAPDAQLRGVVPVSGRPQRHGQHHQAGLGGQAGLGEDELRGPYSAGQWQLGGLVQAGQRPALAGAGQLTVLDAGAMTGWPGRRGS